MAIEHDKYELKIQNKIPRIDDRTTIYQKYVTKKSRMNRTNRLWKINKIWIQKIEHKLRMKKLIKFEDNKNTEKIENWIIH